MGDLGADQLDVPVVDPRQHAQHEHVLAPAGIVHDGEALLFHRDLDDPVVVLRKLVQTLPVLLSDIRVAVRGPHVLQQDDRILGQCPQLDPAQQHLLVEGHHQVRRVAPVGDGIGTEAHAVAAAARLDPRRRLDLCRDDLHRPDAVSHLRADGAENLSALLGTFPGVGDHLHRVLRHPDDLELLPLRPLPGAKPLRPTRSCCHCYLGFTAWLIFIRANGFPT